MPQFDVSRIIRETFITDVDYCPVVDSTNNRAADWAKSGKAKLPLLVLADRQTAGRGRGTNRWWTGEGSLAFSLLVDESFLPESTSEFPLLGLAAGLAAVEAMHKLLPGHQVGLFWPNDIQAAGRKLGGILIEVSGRRSAIIGIGLNVNNSMEDAPAELRPHAVSLFDLTGAKTDLTEILIALLLRLENYFKRLCTYGFSDDLKEVYCRRNNQQISVMTLEGTVTGICRGIAVHDALILETPEGMKTIEIFWALQT